MKISNYFEKVKPKAAPAKSSPAKNPIEAIPKELSTNASSFFNSKITQSEKTMKKSKAKTTVIDDDDAFEEALLKIPLSSNTTANSHSTISSKPDSSTSAIEKVELESIPKSLPAEAAIESEKPKPANTNKKNFYAQTSHHSKQSSEIPVGQENCLLNLAFVFTGELRNISRDDASDLCRRYGGRVTGAVSGKTSFLVTGDDPGESKIKKAQGLGVKVLNEEAFFELVRTSKAQKEDLPKAKPPRKSPAKKAKIETPTILSATESKSVSDTSKTIHKPPLTSSICGIPSNQPIKCPAVSNNSSEAKSDLWTTRYKPSSYSQIMGNKKQIQLLSTWLKTYSVQTRSDKPGSKDDITHSRAVLISGPPGIGKTTAAHLCSRLEGFEVLEFNASDTRSKKTVADVVRESTLALSMGSWFNKTAKRVLVMDEVDGMSAGDRGGVAELISVIKKSKIPIICICNDRQSPKVKSLVNHCYDMRFQRPRTNEIEKVIKDICEREGLSLRNSVVDNLVKSTGGDIRQILNMLSTYSLNNSNLDFDGSKKLCKESEKNVAMGPWEATAALFGRVSFREMPFYEKLEIYFTDFSLMPLMIQENYIRMDPALAAENSGGNQIGKDIETLMCLANAADSIAKGDIISAVQMKTQNWGLLPLHGVISTVTPAFFMHGALVSTGYYGGGWLGKNSSQGKNMRLLKELQMHMRLFASADKAEIRATYLSALGPRLTLPLTQENGIENVISLMDHYYLTREDWDSILDLGLGDCSMKSLTEKIPSNVKSAFTRTYNKMSHPRPYVSASISKSSSNTREVEVDCEEVIEVDKFDEEEQEEEESVEDRLIKVKNTKKNTAKSQKRSADNSAKASVKKPKK